ncbi:MAG TPA: CAP domain-containing protein [Terriglobales bacterium]|nr:CAP domain-containing protein [Terriglobales bacterium]
MLRALITVALLAGTASAAEQAKIKPASSRAGDRPTISEGQPSPSFDEQSEQQLLELANQARAKAGAPPLRFDEGLNQAARAHAEEMMQQRQLSHQFEGEPSLPRRLSVASPLHLDHAGENVAMDRTADGAHQNLMHSPPHRENLLDASYNIAGFGVIRDGDRLYVVQDFGHSVPAYSPEQAEETIFLAINRARAEAHLPILTRQNDPGLHEAACSMAKEDKLGTRAMHDFAQRYSVVSYTSMHPESLSSGAGRLAKDRRMTHVSVGACFAESARYPGGIHWIGLLFY